MINKQITFNIQPTYNELRGCDEVLNNFIRVNKTELMNPDEMDESLLDALEVLKTKLYESEKAIWEEEDRLVCEWEGLLNHYYDLKIKKQSSDETDRTYYKHWLIYPYRIIRTNGCLCFLKLDLDSRYDGIRDTTEMMFDSKLCNSKWRWEFNEITEEEFRDRVSRHTIEVIDTRLHKEANRDKEKWEVKLDKLETPITEPETKA